LTICTRRQTLVYYVVHLQVSYRIGEDGSVGVIYDGQATSTSATSDLSDVAPVSHRHLPAVDAARTGDRLSLDQYQYLNSVIAARAS